MRRWSFIARQHRTGSALEWYRYYKSDIRSWSDFDDRVQKKHGDRRSAAERFVDLTDRAQKFNESVKDHFNLKVRMCKALRLPFKEGKELVLLALLLG